MYGVFACLGVAGTIAASLLPETLGEDFPDTVADLEKRFYHPFFSFRVWQRKPILPKNGEHEMRENRGYVNSE